MREKILVGGFAVVVAFLLATNPVVVNAAGQITGSQIKNNSVASKDIKNNSVKSGDIMDGSLTGADVADGTVSLADLAANSVNGSKIVDGSVASGDITDGTVTSGDVANGTLTHADLTTGSIGIARGYAWIDNGATPIGTATPLTNGYTYNSSGGGITVTRTGVGAYTVTFTGLSWDPGTVLVSGYSSGAVFCNNAGWGSPVATVACYDAAGAAANSSFTVAVFE